ncbi:calcineurin B homologous protein 1 [Culicoides brevitarsis]|uniref:calcineurin B homologous protein 1 n=1 Tax=Culicoides brevitarsis TaxID=469753 RepID=UPI00307C82B2
MGNKSSLLLRKEEIAQIQEESGFTPNQIERLYSRFTALDKNDCGTLSREDFLRIPELAINPLCDRIVHAFFADSNDDRVNFRQFMKVLSLFRPIKHGKENRMNSREEKLRFAFKMYDLDDDDSISRDELLNILHMMVGANIAEDQLISIAERTILEADRSGNGKIAFDDFCAALERTDVERKMSIRFLN